MKNLKNLGKALNKAEQKSINGGSLNVACGPGIPGGCCYAIEGELICWAGPPIQ